MVASRRRMRNRSGTEYAKRAGKRDIRASSPPIPFGDSGILSSAWFFDAGSTNEYSGRGVGLDVVRQMVETFGGHLHLESTRGKEAGLSCICL